MKISQAIIAAMNHPDEWPKILVGALADAERELGVWRLRAIRYGNRIRRMKREARQKARGEK